MEHGKLFAKLRKERGFSQTSLSNGVCNRSTLAAFEQNNSKISMELFLKLIDKMNIGLDEYMYILKNNTHSLKHTFSEKYMLKTKSTFDRKFLDELLEQYEITDDYFYFGLYTQYILIFFYIKKEPLDKKLVFSVGENLKDYLNKIETWSRFEFVLYYNCLFLFDDEFIITHFT